MTYEADAAGFLQMVAAEGDTLAIGAVIAPSASARADEAAALGRGRSEPPRSRRGATPRPQPAPAPQPAAAAAAPERAGRRPRRPRGGAPSRRRAGAGGRVKASPVARRIAARARRRPRRARRQRARGADRQGRRRRRGHGNGAGAAAAAAAAAAPRRRASRRREGRRSRSIEPNRTQQLIARRMASAKATIPEFQVTVDVDAEAAFELREQLRGQAEPLPSINDLVIKACALALRAHPRVNAAYVDGHFEHYGRVNIGIAVAGEGTLVVPTVFDADVKLADRDRRAPRARSRARSATAPSPRPSSPARTFTVSNLGMLGVARFTAVINPPQAAILAVGAASPRAVVGRRRHGQRAPRDGADDLRRPPHRLRRRRRRLPRHRPQAARAPRRAAALTSARLAGARHRARARAEPGPVHARAAPTAGSSGAIRPT